jgi:renalase
MMDVAIIGAGLAGLVCAQTLRQHGYSVEVVEKSRGLGGRLATRRLPQAWADHGVRGLEVQGELTESLIQILCEQDVLRSWQGKYGSPVGITAVAKFLATDLDIHRGKRVEAIARTDQVWHLALSEAQTILAKTIVLAIPAPQALLLLEPLAELSPDFLTALRSVTFNPCITAIATYAPPSIHQPWTAYPAVPEIDWISLENTKSSESPYPVLVVQSSAAFAEQHLEAEDLQPVGQQLLTHAAPFIPPLGDLDLLQVHRWRYAFARQPLPEPYLSAGSLPLVCAGSQVENALRSGRAAAAAISHALNRSLPKHSFSELLNNIHPQM